jgi:hypothetical protein
MRLAIGLLAVLVVAPQSLPPAYPRAGVTALLENADVVVWNIAWLKGQPSPLHRHVYDLVGVYYEPGDRMIISPEGARRPVSTKAWDIAFQRAGVTHIEEGTSDAPLRSVFIEMKRPGSYGTSAAGDAAAFAGEGATQKLDNERVTVWEYTQSPATNRHAHARNTVVVAIDGRSPRALWVPQGTVHASEGTESASRFYVFELK